MIYTIIVVFLQFTNWKTICRETDVLRQSIYAASQNIFETCIMYIKCFDQSDIIIDTTSLAIQKLFTEVETALSLNQ